MEIIIYIVVYILTNLSNLYSGISSLVSSQPPNLVTVHFGSGNSVLGLGVAFHIVACLMASLASTPQTPVAQSQLWQPKMSSDTAKCTLVGLGYWWQ